MLLPKETGQTIGERLVLEKELLSKRTLVRMLVVMPKESGQTIREGLRLEKEFLAKRKFVRMLVVIHSIFEFLRHTITVAFRILQK